MLLFVLHIFGPKAQTRYRCAEVVRDRCNHLRPIFDEPSDAFLHLVQGVGGLAHFEETGLRQRGGINVDAQSFGRMGECG